MNTVMLIIGLLDVGVGVFIYKGTMGSDEPQSTARLGAKVMVTLMLSSAALLIASAVR